MKLAIAVLFNLSERQFAFRQRILGQDSDRPSRVPLLAAKQLLNPLPTRF